MAMEVVWTRMMTPVLRTQVYSFAFIIFAYLGATFVGSILYRDHLKRNLVAPVPLLVALLSVTAFLPIFAVDPALIDARWNISSGMYVETKVSKLFVLGSIVPLCALLGYLTPCLIDQYSGGQPAKAGKAYGINIVGCVLGPLVASYVLIPNMSERFAVVLLALPLLAIFGLCSGRLSGKERLILWPISVAALAWTLFGAGDFDSLLARYELGTQNRRDYAASVSSFGEGMAKRLLVNGIGMTLLVPATKYMIHLPMAYHQGKSQSVLIICFGMGTTFRSALTWDVNTTVVELVPSVPKAFPFYHANAAEVLANPNGHIVIDDGRRFLERCGEKFDIIVVDPPPPVEAAGSSLLYSKEFYDLVKAHLKPNGILGTWIPLCLIDTAQAMVRSMYDSFPYIKSFDSLDNVGTHFFVSMQPIASKTAGELIAAMPAKAQSDLFEWTHTGNLTNDIQIVLSKEYRITSVLNSDLKFAITDQQPFNEYFMLRRSGLYRP